jgi:transposase
VGVNWRTGKKYADCDDWNQEWHPKRQKKRPVMDPVADIVDAWLLDNLRLPKKQRYTAKAIYDRLVAEYDFQGSERTVRDYVAKRKPVLYAEYQVSEEEQALKLEHPGGEAQADFGTVQVVDNGKLKEMHCLVLSFPFSNAGFPYLVPSENAECLLEALKNSFITSVGYRGGSGLTTCRLPSARYLPEGTASTRISLLVSVYITVLIPAFATREGAMKKATWKTK